MTTQITEKKKKKYAVTPEVRINYPAVFEPKAFKKSNTEKYSVQMIIEKKDLPFFKELVDEAIVKKWGEPRPKVKLPFNDGNEVGTSDYENKIYINAKANADLRPWVVDTYRNMISDKSEIYSGCYARVCLWPYAWDGDYGKGISFSLIGLVKTKGGERLDAYEPVDPDEALADVDMTSEADNPNNYDNGLPDYMQ